MSYVATALCLVSFCLFFSKRPFVKMLSFLCGAVGLFLEALLFRKAEHTAFATLIWLLIAGYLGHFAGAVFALLKPSDAAAKTKDHKG